MWILGKREPSWKPGGPARQEGEKAGSWPQTVEEDRCSGMAQNTGDGLATSPRDVYAQSESYCALCNNFYTYNHNRNHVLLYYLFQENKLFGSEHHLHSSSDVREVVSSTLSPSKKICHNFDHSLIKYESLWRPSERLNIISVVRKI